MIPQPCALWCAELEADGSIDVARIIGWQPPGNYGDPDEYAFLPVLLRENSHGVVAGTGYADIVGATLFIAETREDALQAARDWQRLDALREVLDRSLGADDGAAHLGDGGA